MPVLSASTSLVASSSGGAEIGPEIGAIYEGRPWAFATPPPQNKIATIIPQQKRFILVSPLAFGASTGISGCSNVFVNDHPARAAGNRRDAHGLIGMFFPSEQFCTVLTSVQRYHFNAKKLIDRQLSRCHDNMTIIIYRPVS